MADNDPLLVSAVDLKRYILALESRSGQPVELKVSLGVRTPTCESTLELEIYGKLTERPLEVKRVEGLAREFRRDMVLLE